MLTLRPIDEDDREFVKNALQNLWGSEEIVYSGKLYNADRLPGFLAEEKERIVGLLTYFLADTEILIISLNSLVPGEGIGTMLITAVKKLSKESGFKRLAVITTNDNEKAIEFYRKRGFHIRNIRKGEVANSRKIKPSIPLVGENSVPIEDEIEMELSLTD